MLYSSLIWYVFFNFTCITLYLILLFLFTCSIYVILLHTYVPLPVLYVIIMSRTSFRVNPHSIVCLNVKELLARSRCHIWSLSDSNEIRTHNHLVRKRTLNHLASLAKWLSVRLRTKWLWVWISLLSCAIVFKIFFWNNNMVEKITLNVYICLRGRGG